MRRGRQSDREVVPTPKISPGLAAIEGVLAAGGYARVRRARVLARLIRAFRPDCYMSVRRWYPRRGPVSGARHRSGERPTRLRAHTLIAESAGMNLISRSSAPSRRHGLRGLASETGATSARSGCVIMAIGCTSSPGRYAFGRMIVARFMWCSSARVTLVRFWRL